MQERLWDLFVDAMRVFFMPLVCSYFTLTADLFFNVSVRNATGLERAANVLLSPVQYLLVGQEALLRPDGSWEFIQRFDYKEAFWIKTGTSLVALAPSLVLGTVVKGLSLFTE